MRETLIVVGLVVLAVALRSSRPRVLRKLGAMVMLVASFLTVYFLTGSVAGGVAGAALWFFLPWIELLTRIRRMRLPLNNRLHHRKVPNPSFFPNATEAAAAMEEAGFEHVSDCGWEWAGMQQFFRLFWHPEERAVAAVCLCEQSDVAFAFISITSHDANGKIWRTTNFPFAPTLQCPPNVRWNHVPCERSCFHQILADHRKYLERMGIPADRLRMPDPEEIENSIEQEMRTQVEHNLAAGLIQLTGDGHFQYSNRGLLLLLGNCFWREASETDVGRDRRAGKRGLIHLSLGFTGQYMGASIRCVGCFEPCLWMLLGEIRPPDSGDFGLHLRG